MAARDQEIHEAISEASSGGARGYAGMHCVSAVTYSMPRPSTPDMNSQVRVKAQRVDGNSAAGFGVPHCAHVRSPMSFLHAEQTYLFLLPEAMNPGHELVLAEPIPAPRTPVGPALLLELTQADAVVVRTKTAIGDHSSPRRFFCMLATRLNAQECFSVSTSVEARPSCRGSPSDSRTHSEREC